RPQLHGSRQAPAALLRRRVPAMTSVAVAPRPRGSRSPGIVFGALSAVILVLVAALTVTASRNGPPAIAEYAPQAAQQIKQAPLEQTSNVGGAAGAEGEETTTTTTTAPPPPAAGAGPTTTTTEPTIERPRVRRCVGNPPRQTEDPQSPPCVAYWTGDNGGATYKNVTGDTIVVAAPAASPRVMADLEAYFNKRYEFYGRK